MVRIDRRRLLKLSGAGAAAAASGGLAGILASGRAPAYAQQANVHWLRWSDFVPASDQLLLNQIVPECQKALGITLRIEMVNANDIQARVTSAVQSGTGPDIILALNNWPQLYIDSLADVSDVADKLGADQGGYYPISKAVATAGGKWIGVPWCIGGGLVAYRKSWFQEIGYDKFPDTWDKLQAAGKILKAKGRPIGQALSHSFGDPPGFWYPWLWSWGGKEVEADGKTVALDSKETVESVKRASAVLERGLRLGRPRLGRFEQQPRVSVGQHQRHQQRRLDLSRGQAQAGCLPDRKGDADVSGHPARAIAERSGRPIQPSGPVHQHADGLFKEPGGRQAIHYLGQFKADLSSSGLPRSRATRSERPRIGPTTRYGKKTRCCCRSAIFRTRGG